MSTPTLNPTLATIDKETATFAPPVADAIQAAESTGGSGFEKFAAALGTLAGNPIIAAANPDVASIVSLVNIGVAFAHLFGAFKHKTPAPVPAPPPNAPPTK